MIENILNKTVPVIDFNVKEHTYQNKDGYLFHFKLYSTFGLIEESLSLLNERR